MVWEGSCGLGGVMWFGWGPVVWEGSCGLGGVLCDIHCGSIARRAAVGIGI